VAFEEFEYKDVKGERCCGFFASNAHPSNLVTFVRGQSASVCCHTDNLTQKRRTLSRGRVTLEKIKQNLSFLSSAP
jgi:hypothetical protein